MVFRLCSRRFQLESVPRCHNHHHHGGDSDEQIQRQYRRRSLVPWHLRIVGFRDPLPSWRYPHPCCKLSGSHLGTRWYPNIQLDPICCSIWPRPVLRYHRRLHEGGTSYYWHCVGCLDALPATIWLVASQTLRADRSSKRKLLQPHLGG